MGAFKVGDKVRLKDSVIGQEYAKRFDLEGILTITNIHDNTAYFMGSGYGAFVGWLEHVNTNAAPTGINPKDLIGSKKPDYQYVPMAPIYETGRAMKDGANKYGPFNWREQPVNADVYVNAARRHIDLWFSGEERAEDSGVHHLAHAMACMMILLDAQQHNSLNDNRVRDDALLRLIKENSK